MENPRYYVNRNGRAWIVCDRLKLRLQNDVVIACATRKEARAECKKLNDGEKAVA